MVGVVKRPTIAKPLYLKAFEGCYGRSVGLFRKILIFYCFRRTHVIIYTICIDETDTFYDENLPHATDFEAISLFCRKITPLSHQSSKKLCIFFGTTQFFVLPLHQKFKNKKKK